MDIFVENYLYYCFKKKPPHEINNADII